MRKALKNVKYTSNLERMRSFYRKKSDGYTPGYEKKHNVFFYEIQLQTLYASEIWRYFAPISFDECFLGDIPLTI